MRKTLTLLVASTALTAVIGTVTWSAMTAAPDRSHGPLAVFQEDAAQPLVLASEDDDDDDDEGRGAHRDHDDDDDDDDGDDEDDEEDDDCDEDDDNCPRGTPDPAPSGTAAPPRNGLFGTGAPPQVRVN